MKWKHWELVGLVVLVAVVLGAVTYAAKDEGKDVILPDVVTAAIKALYPAATVEEAEWDEEELEVYEVELEANGNDVAEVTVAPDGTIVEVETEVAVGDLPQAVLDAVAQAAEGAEIKEAEKEVTYAVVKLIKLDEPTTSYEVELIKNGKECEIEVAADGTILEELECRCKHGHEGKKHDDDNKGQDDDQEHDGHHDDD